MVQSKWLKMIWNMRTTEETHNTGNYARQSMEVYGRVGGKPALYVGAIDSVVTQNHN